MRTRNGVSKGTYSIFKGPDRQGKQITLRSHKAVRVTLLGGP